MGYSLRSPSPYFYDLEERPIWRTGPYAPTFDGRPMVYIDWEEQMDQYFEWYPMSESQKVRFAQCKLTQLARSHWSGIERESYYGEEKIRTWRDMKSKLREKYLDRSYERRLLDRWYRLRQDDRSVSEYIEEFQEFVRRCNTPEPKSETIARFRDGLHRDIRRELLHWRIYSLEDAYDTAREFESYQREVTPEPIPRHRAQHREVTPEPIPRYQREFVNYQVELSKVNTSEHKPNPSQLSLDQPTPTVPLVHMNDRNNNPEVQIECTNIQDLGYLRIEELGEEEDKSEPIEEVYEADMSLIDENEGEDFEEDNSNTLPEETLGEEEIVEPSPKTSEPREISEGLVPISECPQEEPSSIDIIVEDFKALTQQGQVSPTRGELVGTPKATEDFKVKLPKDLPDDLPLPRSIHPTLELVPIENFKIILSSQSLFQSCPRLPQDSNSYFLPFPESYHISRATRFQFEEITRLYESLDPVLFATYFWHTLWHLLGIHDKFSCAYQTRVKPRELVFY